MHRRVSASRASIRGWFSSIDRVGPDALVSDNAISTSRHKLAFKCRPLLHLMHHVDIALDLYPNNPSHPEKYNLLEEGISASDPSSWDIVRTLRPIISQGKSNLSTLAVIIPKNELSTHGIELCIYICRFHAYSTCREKYREQTVHLLSFRSTKQ